MIFFFTVKQSRLAKHWYSSRVWAQNPFFSLNIEYNIDSMNIFTWFLHSTLRWANYEFKYVVFTGLVDYSYSLPLSVVFIIIIL